MMCQYLCRLYLWAVLAATMDAAAASEQSGRFVSKSYDSRHEYKLYIPAQYSKGQAMPLVLMLHGCWQSPDRFARNSRMNRQADRHGFIVVYPTQPFLLPGRLSLQAITLGCWRWFDPANQVRESRELGRIVGIIKEVLADYTIDEHRIYAVGVSAGAAMAVNLAVTHPDLITAVGVSGGIAYGAASSMSRGFRAMRSGAPDPDALGRAAHAAMGPYARVVPIIVFHGADDPFVAPRNSEDLIAQWARTNDLADDATAEDRIDAIPDAIAESKAMVEDGHEYTVFSYTDGTERVVMKRYLVEGMRHAWSGGTADPPWIFLFMYDPFVDARGPDASRIMWEFLQTFHLE